MKIAGEQTYAVSKDDLWQAILDAEVLSRTLPGCEDLKQTGENEYAGKLKMKVGPVQGIFEGKVTITDLDPPNSYNLVIDGKGAPGFVKGTGHIDLEEGEEGTLLRYDIDAQVGGRIAAVGQRLLDSSAKVITRQGLEGLGRQLEARRAEAEADTDEGEGDAQEFVDDDPNATHRIKELPAAPEGPTQAELAKEVIKGVADDLVPTPVRWMLVVGAILLILTLVAVWLRLGQ